MSLIDDDNKAFPFLCDRILQHFPDRILPIISMFSKVAVYTEFLGIQEVNMSIFQSLSLETVIQNHALAEAETVSLQVELVLGLLIEFWGIGKPKEHGIRHLREDGRLVQGMDIKFVPVEDTLH